ncbi:MAG: hypothetical protein AAFW89_13930 [Bacteroidota bacterium]
MSGDIELNAGFKKHTLFLGLILCLSVLIRVIWAFWIGREYWGDAYHNLWMIQQTNELGTYFDYKDRHLVWLPAYRFLLLAEDALLGLKLSGPVLPFLLQLTYMSLAGFWIQKHARKLASPLFVAVILLWPLPVLFGGFNMSEGLALVTVTATFLFVKKEPALPRTALIILLCAISALTRHEATAFLGIYALVLFLMRFRKSSFAVLTGLSIGIALLCVWNGMLINDPFFWLTSKFNASSSGASEIIERGGMLPRIAEALFAVLLVFPSLPVLWLGAKRKWLDRFTYSRAFKPILPALYSTFCFLLIFLIASLFFFHGADPKYLLLASFPLSVLTAFWIIAQKRGVQRFMTALFTLLIPLYSVLFYARSYNLELERTLGTQLTSVIDDQSNIWCDFPTVLVYAHWNPQLVISTDQISSRLTDSEPNVVSTLKSEKITHIIAADYDHSKSLDWFPELASDTAFVVRGIRFEPIYRHKPPVWEGFNVGKPWLNQLRTYVISLNKPLYVWSITTLEQNVPNPAERDG